MDTVTLLEQFANSTHNSITDPSVKGVEFNAVIQAQSINSAKIIQKQFHNIGYLCNFTEVPRC